MILFEINKDKELVIKMAIIMAVPEFATIWRTVHKIPGDSDGRDKLRNLQLMMYVFFMAEIRSINPLAALAGSKRTNKALEMSGLGLDFKPDKVLKPQIDAAIEKYGEILRELAPDVATLDGAKKAMLQIPAQINIAVEQNAMLLEKIQKLAPTLLDEDMDIKTKMENIALLDAFNKSVQSNMDYLRNLLKDLPRVKETVDGFEEAVLLKVNTNIQIYGGGVLYNRELPPKERMK